MHPTQPMAALQSSVRSLWLAVGQSDMFVNSFCRPDQFDEWSKISNQLARFTPCFTDVVILTSAHVVMIVMCVLRLRLLKSLPPSKRYRANSRPVLVARVLGAAYCALIPILQLGARLSLATAGTEPLAPFEIFALVTAALAWAVTSHTFYMERCLYVREGAWYTRLAVLYVLSGNLAKLQFVWLLIGENSKVFFYFFLSNVAVNALLGLFALFWFPPLEKCFQSDEHPEEEAGANAAEGAAYMPLADEAPIDADTSVCPERKANFISRLLFSWITPVMAVGYKRPLQDPDVWQLDTWDRTDTIADQFNRCWEAELKRGKPSLLRALHKAFGGRFWIGGIYKIGNDASQFVGPVFLNLLLAAMQNGEPSWKGYLYGVSIFVGLMLGVLCEGQYFQNVMRVGFRLRTAIIAAVFRKSLHLSFRGRQSFSAGRITNMMTSDAEALQQVLQSLHNLWSAPVRIIIACVLLYGALGIASIVSLLVLLLMIPTQAIVVTTVQRLVKQTLQRTDKRVDLIQELLAAMDIVKFYAWEHSFEKKVENIREEELSWLRKSAVVSAFNMFLLNVVPVLVSVVAFSVYAWLGNELTPAKAFSSIALFNVLRFPLYTFPQLISQVINAMVSVRRLEDLLIAEERQLEANPPTDPTKPAIVVHDTDFAWDPKTHEPTLHSVSLEIPAGSLTAIVGGTGQGKSSLVAALLGEMPTMESGALEDHMNGRMAYVPQSSWIFNATIRDNILFGLPYNRSRYEEALRVSQLVRDLELLPGGDLTEIGERGVNVSGGQKQRISIARAVYADADVYFFDDPLSALDAHVGKQVFDECIRGALDGRTRVMVTNQLHFLRHVDNVLLIKDGTIVERGTFDELKANGKEFQHLLEQAGSMEEEDEETDPKKKAAGKVAGEKAVGAVVAQSDAKQAKTDGGKAEAGGTHLIKEEERATGLVRPDVIWRYVAAMGGTSMLVLLLAFFIVVEIARVGASLWLSVWSGAGRHPPHSVAYYIGIYAGISSGQMLLTLANQLFLALIGIIAARALHNAMLHTVLRAPMVFFQSTPLGRLINRFTKDIADVDKNLIQYTAMFLRGFFQLFSTFALIAFLTPFALTVITPLLFAFYMLYLYFQSTAREVKRLDSITRSPVYALFGEALSGLPTIRAYRAHDRLAAINGRAVDLNTRYTLVNMSANRWLSIRLEFLGGLMILATAIFAVLGQGNTDADARARAAPQIGLILSYALSITSLMTMTLRLASLFENSFNSVERIGEYTEIPPEGPEVIPDHRPPAGWPDKGAIEFKDVVMRYRPELPPVLKGLTVSIKPAEKVGVVGRTGAGKSTIFNTLFRMVEIESGEIDIDGINIATIGLADLRRKLSIIPQTPVLFTGTIRFNLDPFNEHPDSELWEALERAHLKPVIAKSPLGLDTEVTEGGENFSVGQRQLVSLARALVRRSKILVLDEATAAVDIATDSLIQKTIREEFKNCTLLTIAHRLNTIIDSDRILVLDDGRAVEFDSAAKLLKNKGGLFYSLVQSTGSANAHYLERIASGSMDAKEEREQHAKEGKRKLDRESVSRKWMSATRWALAKALAQSTGDLQKSGPVSESVRDAVSLLRGVLQGERREEIAAELEQLQVSEERWYQALVRVVESLATMGRQLRTRLTDGGEKDDLWSTVAFAYDQTDQ